MTLTLNLSTSHLTTDTESEQHVFLRNSFLMLLKLHLTEVSTALTHVFKNKSVASEKHLELRVLLMMSFFACKQSVTHSERSRDPLLGWIPSTFDPRPPFERHCNRLCLTHRRVTKREIRKFYIELIKKTALVSYWNRLILRILV